MMGRRWVIRLMIYILHYNELTHNSHSLGSLQGNAGFRSSTVRTYEGRVLATVNAIPMVPVVFMMSMLSCH